MSDLKFSDLTQYDRDLVKSLALTDYVNTRQHDGAVAIMNVVFDMIAAKGFKIVKDETKESTWSQPNPSWYTKQPVRRDWWRK